MGVSYRSGVQKGPSAIAMDVLIALRVLGNKPAVAQDWKSSSKSLLLPVV